MPRVSEKSGSGSTNGSASGAAGTTKPKERTGTKNDAAIDPAQLAAMHQAHLELWQELYDIVPFPLFPNRQEADKLLIPIERMLQRRGITETLNPDRKDMIVATLRSARILFNRFAMIRAASAGGQDGAQQQSQQNIPPVMPPPPPPTPIRQQQQPTVQPRATRQTQAATSPVPLDQLSPIERDQLAINAALAQTHAKLGTPEPGSIRGNLPGSV